MTEIHLSEMRSAVFAAAALLLVGAALHDVAARTVPNTVSALTFALGCAARLVDGRIAPALLACLAVFIAAAFCWRRGWMGGGDVKLLAAAAMLVPPASVPSFVLDVALAGGGLAGAYLLLRTVVPSPEPSSRRPRSMLARVLRAERWRIHRNCPLPYASAIAAGALICMMKA